MGVVSLSYLDRRVLRDSVGVWLLVNVLRTVFCLTSSLSWGAELRGRVFKSCFEFRSCLESLFKQSRG